MKKNPAQRIANKAVKNAGGKRIGRNRFSAVKAVKKLKKASGK